MADKKKLVIDEFAGSVQTIDDVLLPPGAVPWLFGLIDIRENKLARIGGKLCLNDSSLSYEAVIDLEQLEFRDENFVYVHHSSQREIVESADLTPIGTAPDGIEEYGE